jgi:hypothetical protein
MRYERPIVMELGSRAKARGQGPQSCISGGTASGQMICQTGADGFDAYATDCLAGIDPVGYTYTACAAGDTATWECSVGPAASWQNDCTVGPSAIL